MKITFIGSGDACATGGKNQTCFLIEDTSKTFLVDCGPASLAALRKNGFNTEKIDFVINTHMHGDHFGGIPYLLMDMDINCQRKRAFKIFGPENIGIRVPELMNVLYPGYLIKNYQVSFHNLKADSLEQVEGYNVQTFLMEHKAYSDCLGYRISNNNFSFAYTGDTAWTEKIFDLAKDTDVFICECSLYEKNLNLKHIAYKELIANIDKIKTQRLILTHLSQDMFDNLSEVNLEIAYDNLEVNI